MSPTVEIGFERRHRAAKRRGCDLSGARSPDRARDQVLFTRQRREILGTRLRQIGDGLHQRGKARRLHRCSLRRPLFARQLAQQGM